MKLVKPLLCIGSLSLLTLSACSDKPADRSHQPATLAAGQPVSSFPRWYSAQHVARGGPLFQTHCAGCHMADASGTRAWRKPDAQGKYPPPPLNGSAHAWHHPFSVLRRTIRDGGSRLGGSMPPFRDKLDDRQITDLIAWVQSHWPDDTYRVWSERNAQDSRSMQRMNKAAWTISGLN